MTFDPKECIQINDDEIREEVWEDLLTIVECPICDDEDPTQLSSMQVFIKNNGFVYVICSRHGEVCGGFPIEAEALEVIKGLVETQLGS